MPSEPPRRTVHGYGWHPSLPDHRDYAMPAAAVDTVIPPEVDPRPTMPPIYDQSRLGSCTANAVAAAVEYFRMTRGGPTVTPSRLFIYYVERMLEGTLGEGDVGAMGRDGFAAMRHYGAPPEDAWPYDIARYAERPPESVWTLAYQHRLRYEYAAVPRDQRTIMAAFARKETVAFGFTVFESFESDAVAQSGIVPMPGRGEAILGGHEVLAVGYLARLPDHVLCRNSWGTGWGMAGYFVMPWAYMLDPGLAGDLRAITRPVIRAF